MLKVDEKIDLSKKVLGIDIESPIFEEMLDNLNNTLKTCIKKVYDKQFVGGDITLKITFDVPEDYKKFPVKDEATGDMIVKSYMYRTFSFKHKVTGTLKKQFSEEGEYREERELKEGSNGEFIAVPLIEPQISMFDER